MWASIQTSIDELWQDQRIRALAIMVGSLLAAYIVEFIIRRTVLVAAAKTETELDDQIVAAVRKPIFWTVILLGTSWATSLVLVGGRFIIYGIVGTLVVFTWTIAAIRVAELVLGSVSLRAKEGAFIQRRTVPVFSMLSKIVFIGAAAYFIFLAWEIDVSAWIASAGIVGIAVGFAARDSLANLFAGIFLLADNIYKVGDFIVLNNDPALRGRVNRIGMRSTRILTIDNVEINVPNSLVGNATVVNEVGGPSVRQRIRAKVSVAYGSDVDRVFEVLSGCGEEVEGVSQRPAPEVQFREFGGSGLEFELMVWITNPADRHRIISRLNTRIYKALAQAGIEIPYSKHDVYIKQMPGSED